MDGVVLKDVSIVGGSVSCESKLGKKSVILVVMFFSPDRDARRFWLGVCMVKILCLKFRTIWEHNKCCGNYCEFSYCWCVWLQTFCSRCVVLLAVGFSGNQLTEPTSRPWLLTRTWSVYGPKKPSRFVRNSFTNKGLPGGRSKSDFIRILPEDPNSRDLLLEP